MLDKDYHVLWILSYNRYFFTFSGPRTAAYKSQPVTSKFIRQVLQKSKFQPQKDPWIGGLTLD